MIAQKELKEKLYYSVITGHFNWLISPTSNVKAGSIAGCLTKGYIVIRVNKRLYRAHHLAWLYVHNKMPQQLDHIDQVKSHNQIINLREATTKENARNQPKRKSNTSGITGVCWDKKNNKWAASIKVDYIKIHLGRFANKFEAACARKSAEIKHGFHPNHGR